jgi:cytochrome c oxidase cbb3-type subunit 2
MNRAFLIFLGAFAVLTFSWAGLVLGNQRSYASAITPFFDDTESKAYPEQTPGLVARGKLVYQDLGCVYCHTQQVRASGYGADVARGWNGRDTESGSVARDYLRENRVLLGDQRIGPDLRNFGARVPAPDAAALYLHLYAPPTGSTMPAYRFLFTTKKISGSPSPKALALTGALAPAAGYEILPTERAEVLVAYLLALKDSYNQYPELKNIFTPPAPEKGHAEGAKTSEGKK